MGESSDPVPQTFFPWSLWWQDTLASSPSPLSGHALVPHSRCWKELSHEIEYFPQRRPWCFLMELSCTGIFWLSAMNDMEATSAVP